MNWKDILEALNEKGVTDAKIAKHAGLSQAQIHRLKHDKANDIYSKKGIKILDLCDTVGVSTAKLID